MQLLNLDGLVTYPPDPLVKIPLNLPLRKGDVFFPPLKKGDKGGSLSPPLTICAIMEVIKFGRRWCYCKDPQGRFKFSEAFKQVTCPQKERDKGY